MLSAYSQDTIPTEITNKDSITNIDLTPKVIKMGDSTYYCFYTEQTAYLFNGLIQRDFYFDKYQEKTKLMRFRLIYVLS